MKQKKLKKNPSPVAVPAHLKKYIVAQNYRKYTAEDQSVYRYIMRQLKDFLSEHAYAPHYLRGLKETGITIDRIPRISDIDRQLKKLGWRAVPVSGFIPPSAFMEFQLKNILPVASALRTRDHISYTPAPDIIHEASGHTPFLVHPVFNSFLQAYAKVVIKAITNRQDFEQYSAIRHLSDIKENPRSTKRQIQQAEEHLKNITHQMGALSESSRLSRFIWWTSEYGLTGPLKSPKIYGAGLLSSLGEAKACLSPAVRKIPLSASCVEYSYDITKYQPQLFVTPDFETLHMVLEDLAKQLAFYRGGAYGLKQAQKAGTVCTLELETGLQISGVLEHYVQQKGQPAFIKLKGPSQLSYGGNQLKGHGTKTHAEGYSSPLGPLKGEDKPLHQTPLSEFKRKHTQKNGGRIKLNFHSGWVLEGQYVSSVLKNKHPLLVRFKDCRVYKGSKVYYRPEWGMFDLALGKQVKSVFGGPADRLSYGERESFEVARVPAPVWTVKQKQAFSFYRKIRKVREEGLSSTLASLMEEYNKKFSDNYLMGVELWELMQTFHKKKEESILKKHLVKMDKKRPDLFIKNAMKRFCVLAVWGLLLFPFPSESFYAEIYRACINSEKPFSCAKQEWQKRQSAVDSQTGQALAEMKQSSVKCPSNCSNGFWPRAVRFGSAEGYTEIKDQIKMQGPECAQNILDTLQEQIQNLRFPEECVNGENRICAFLSKHLDTLNGKISELLDMAGITEESTSAKALCLECESSASTDEITEMKNLVNDLKEQSQCQLPKAGEEKIVQTGKPLNQSYVLKKEPDGSYSIPFNISFSADKDYDGPVPRQHAEDYYMKKAQECMQKASTKMLGPGGKKLKIVLKSPPPKEKDPCRGKNTKEIKIGSSAHRSHAGKYSSDIDCPTITHEVLHLTGLCDEYEETQMGYYVHPFTGEVKGATQDKDKPDSKAMDLSPAYDFKPAYDCRVTRPNSIMSNQYERWDNVFEKGENASLLQSGQFNRLLYGTCEEKNKMFNECSQLAYQSSVKEPDCLAKKAKCEGQSGSGRPGKGGDRP